MSLPSVKVLACLVVITAASPCTDTYKDVLKGKSKVVPKDVGGLYLKWCKKNMKVSSAKSMDELCTPLVKKVEEKMQWVPADEKVTPEIACEKVDALKQKYPEQVAIAEAAMKSQGADAAAKKQIMDTAKAMKGKLEGIVKAKMGAISKQLVEELGAELRTAAEEVAGKDSDSAPRETLAKTMEGTVSMGIRGMETKLLQKLEEAVGQWGSASIKAAAAAAKEKKEL